VEIRRVSEKTLFGTAPDEIRHFIEIRGVGILDVKNLYGVGAVKPTENINLVIQLEFWDQRKTMNGWVWWMITRRYLESYSMPYHSRETGQKSCHYCGSRSFEQQTEKMGYNAARALNERIIGKGRMRPSYE